MAKDTKHKTSAGHQMVRVLCPQNGGQPTFANSAKNGPRCTKCGKQDHKPA